MHLQERNGLYTFDLSKRTTLAPTPTIHRIYQANTATSTMSTKRTTKKGEELLEQWNLRLEHLNKDDIIKMIDLLAALLRNNPDIGFCKVCVESRQQ